MNRKQAKELLPIIQAYVNGWEIEIRCSDEWIDLCDNPIFDGVPENYRIKPEPRVLYVNDYGGDLAGVNWTTKKEAVAVRGRGENSDNAKTVKFIEVLE